MTGGIVAGNGGNAGEVAAGMANPGGSVGGMVAGGQPQVGGEGGMGPMGGLPVEIPGVEIDFAFSSTNILQNLSADPRFSQLLRMIQVGGAELVAELTDETRTLFAPTDDGLDAFFIGDRADELFRIKTRGPDAREFVRRHLLRGSRDLEYLRSQARLSSVSGRFLTTAVNGENDLRVEGVDINQPAVRASNGLIHPIDSVIERPLPVETSGCDEPEMHDAPVTIYGSLVSIPRAVYRVTIPQTGQYCVDTEVPHSIQFSKSN